MVSHADKYVLACGKSKGDWKQPRIDLHYILKNDIYCGKLQFMVTTELGYVLVVDSLEPKYK